MIEFVYLTDCANIEPCPQKGKKYPIGTIILQLSATKGQILYLTEESEIESKYAVITSKSAPSFYLFSLLKNFFPRFFEQRKQGLNFRASELNSFQFPIHQDIKTQRLISHVLQKMGASREDFYPNKKAVK